MDNANYWTNVHVHLYGIPEQSKVNMFGKYIIVYCYSHRHGDMPGPALVASRQPPQTQ